MGIIFAFIIRYDCIERLSVDAKKQSQWVPALGAHPSSFLFWVAHASQGISPVSPPLFTTLYCTLASCPLQPFFSLSRDLLSNRFLWVHRGLCSVLSGFASQLPNKDIIKINHTNTHEFHLKQQQNAKNSSSSASLMTLLLYRPLGLLRSVVTVQGSGKHSCPAAASFLSSVFLPPV